MIPGMPIARLDSPRSRRALVLAVALAAATAWAGCSTARRPVTAVGVEAPPRVMVTLAGSQRPQWDRITYELSLAYSLRVHQRWRMRTLDLYCVVFELPLGRSIDLAVRRLASDHRVETAAPIRSYRTLDGTPLPGADPPRADPYAHLQHASRAMRVGEAHRWATGDGVRVAVVDTGVDIGHPDLRGRIDAAQNFVDHGEKTFTRDIHGTAVAGILAASGNNGLGIAGVAPDARLLALKACWPEAPSSSLAACDNYTLSKAIDWALAEESRVINLSLTGPRDPVLERLLDTAATRGVAVVAAVQAGPDPGFPASYPGVIPVRASGTGNGTDGALAAPGVDILSTIPGGGYEFFSGSSMAAAHVSGVIALLLEKRPRLTPAELTQRLRTGMRELPPDGGRGDDSEGSDPPAAASAGERTVDACASLAAVLRRDPKLCRRPVALAGGDPGGPGSGGGA